MSEAVSLKLVFSCDLLVEVGHKFNLSHFILSLYLHFSIQTSFVSSDADYAFPQRECDADVS